MASSSPVAFNALLKDFMSQLKRAFPNDPTISAAKKKLKGVVASSPGLASSLYKRALAGHETRLRARDPALLAAEPGHVLKKTLGVDLGKIAEVADDTTKEKIWDFLIALLDATDGTIPNLEAALFEGLDKTDLKGSLETLANRVDPSIVHQIVQGIDPGLASQMKSSLESGELMAHVRQAIAGIDPVLLSGVASSLSAVDDSASLMESVQKMVASMDPATLGALGGALSP